MASKIPVWGVDVGQCSLKAIKLQAAGDGVEMLGFDVAEHESILSEAEADSTAMILKAIETFASRNDFKKSRVVVAVPGQQTLTRFTKMPPVEAKKIPDMVQYEASQQIPFDMDEVVWDYQVFMEKGSPDVEVGIFAIRKELIRNYLAYFTDRGVEPSIVQTSPMASYNAARFENPPAEHEAIVLLDMGALATDLIIAEGSRIWSRPVPIGGNRFTEALVSAFKISFKKAEKLKRTAATSKHARQVFAAMRPVFADLVSEVQRSVGFYTSTHREAQITRVLGMGNAFKLPGLQKFLQQNLGLTVDRLSGFRRMAAGPAEASPAFAENVMSLSVAYGLAVQGLGLASVESNLLPPEVRRSLLWRRKQPWFAASAACLALGAASVWVGNVLAGGELTGAMGSLSSVAPASVRGAEEAERILNAGGSESPIERAAKVAGAARALQAALSEVDRLRTGDQDMFSRMAKLTENNVFAPRILDAVHRAVASTARPEVRAAQTPEAYLELARRIPRAERREVWIDSLEMLYDAKDPSKHFASQQETTKKPGSLLAKAGWALRIVGTITDPRPAQWLEETLKPALEKVGKAPDRGFYFESVALEKVIRKSDAGPTLRQRLGQEGGERVTPGRAATGRRPTAVGSRAEVRGAVGRGVPPPGGERAAGPQSLAGEISDLRQKFSREDALTGEDISEDQVFVLNVVVRKGNTPANLVPDEYKPKKAEPAKGGKTGGA
jgi:type IV pilus assembly protein PilM